MMKSYKFLIILFLLGFVGYKLFLFVNQFASTRIIEVQKEIYESNEKNYLKGYHIVNVPFEQFDIQVAPKSFLDYLFLTNDRGNLLSILSEIIAALWLAWLVYRIDLENIFLEYFTKLDRPFILIMTSFLARSYGITYTSDFWKRIYTYKGNIDFWQHDFYVNTTNRYLLYLFVLATLLNFYNYVINYYKKATPKIDI